VHNHAYCWIKKGTEKEIKSNTGRERININGVYCVETQEVTYNKYYEKFVDFEKAVLHFFGEWFSQHKKKLSTFVTDNFKALGT